MSCDGRLPSALFALSDYSSGIGADSWIMSNFCYSTLRAEPLLSLFLSQTCTTTQASQHEKSVCHFFMLQLLGNSNCKKRLWLAGCCYPSTNFKFIHLSSIDICWFSGVHGCQFFSKIFCLHYSVAKGSGRSKVIGVC